MLIYVFYRYGFILERKASLAKHYLAFYYKGNNLVSPKLENWNKVAKSREVLPEQMQNALLKRLQVNNNKKITSSIHIFTTCFFYFLFLNQYAIMIFSGISLTLWIFFALLLKFHFKVFFYIYSRHDSRWQKIQRNISFELEVIMSFAVFSLVCNICLWFFEFLL